MGIEGPQAQESFEVRVQKILGLEGWIRPGDEGIQRDASRFKGKFLAGNGLITFSDGENIWFADGSYENKEANIKIEELRKAGFEEHLGMYCPPAKHFWKSLEKPS